MEIYFCFIEHALLLRSGCRLSSDGLLMAGMSAYVGCSRIEADCFCGWLCIGVNSSVRCSVIITGSHEQVELNYRQMDIVVS